VNVYAKLVAARKSFHSKQLKKTGHNKFAGYDYFELGDFLIPALDSMAEFGLSAVISFDETIAKLTIVNCEKPEEQIVVTSPMSSCEMKGLHKVQQLGAVQTYLRRYLWVAALEIVEHDAIDASDGAAPSRPAKPKTEDAPKSSIPKHRTDAIDEMALYMIECHNNGQDMPAIAMWYDAANFTGEDPNEERLYLWGLLKNNSKLRSAIKANKPEAQ
jgi:hypothetical protein